MKHFLTSDRGLHGAQDQFILEAAKFCYEHNYFVFKGEYYLQIHGMAMGTSFAPCYANLSMGY